jgi:uncharacterized membrane protein YedE/YeeE
MDWLFLPRWPAIAVGVAIGLLECATFLFLDKPIGCSTAFTRTSGLIERAIRGSKTDEKPYYRLFPPVIDWEWVFVAGIPLGAFLSAVSGGTFRIEWAPSLWITIFGPGVFRRLATALAGGFLVGLGARWAGGCTSGHGISGCLQLALSSWLAAASFFGGGILAAILLFSRAGG